MAFKRLRDILVRPQHQRLFDSIGIPISCHHDNGRVGPAIFDLLEKIESAPARHLDIRYDNIEKTIQRIKDLHSYELPDIIVLPIIGGLKEYLDYIVNETA